MRRIHVLSVFIILGLLVVLSEFLKKTDIEQTSEAKLSQSRPTEMKNDKPISTNSITPIKNLEQDVLTQDEDYQEQAYDLLQKSLGDDGQSQYELVRLLSHCQGAVEIIDTPDSKIRDVANKLFSYPLTTKERAMLSQLILELDKCGSFHGGGFQQFLSGYESNQNLSGSYNYWLTKSLTNGYPSAAIILLGFHSHGVLDLSEDQLAQSAQMLVEIVKNPSKEELKWINQVFLDSKFKSAPVVNIKYEQTDSVEEVIRYSFNTNIVSCLQEKYIETKFKEFSVDCGESVQRYGRWYDPKNANEIEAEAKKIKESWSKSDFFEAGYNSLFINLMSYQAP